MEGKSGDVYLLIDYRRSDSSARPQNKFLGRMAGRFNERIGGLAIYDL